MDKSDKSFSPSRSSQLARYLAPSHGSMNKHTGFDTPMHSPSSSSRVDGRTLGDAHYAELSHGLMLNYAIKETIDFDKQHISARAKNGVSPTFRRFPERRPYSELSSSELEIMDISGRQSTQDCMAKAPAVASSSESFLGGTPKTPRAAGSSGKSTLVSVSSPAHSSRALRSLSPALQSPSHRSPGACSSSAGLGRRAMTSPSSGLQSPSLRSPRACSSQGSPQHQATLGSAYSAELLHSQSLDQAIRHTIEFDKRCISERRSDGISPTFRRPPERPAGAVSPGVTMRNMLSVERPRGQYEPLTVALTNDYSQLSKEDSSITRAASIKDRSDCFSVISEASTSFEALSDNGPIPWEDASTETAAAPAAKAAREPRTLLQIHGLSPLEWMQPNPRLEPARPPSRPYSTLQRTTQPPDGNVILEFGTRSASPTTTRRRNSPSSPSSRSRAPVSPSRRNIKWMDPKDLVALVEKDTDERLSQRQSPRNFVQTVEEGVISNQKSPKRTPRSAHREVLVHEYTTAIHRSIALKNHGSQTCFDSPAQMGHIDDIAISTEGRASASMISQSTQTNNVAAAGAQPTMKSGEDIHPHGELDALPSSSSWVPAASPSESSVSKSTASAGASCPVSHRSPQLDSAFLAAFLQSYGKIDKDKQ